MNVNSDMKKGYAFIITKPLQLMVVLSIIDQLPSFIQKTLLVVDSFADAKGVSKRLETVLPSDLSIKFFDAESSAYGYMRNKGYSKIFIDSDVGFSRYVTLLVIAILSPGTIFAVYEEGVGTYRNDLYAGVKKKILPLIGCGIYFGGNWRTKELYLYRPDKCMTPVNAKKIKIEKKIHVLMREKKLWLEYIFDASNFFSELSSLACNYKKCEIYLTNWKIDSKVIDGLNCTSSFVIVKPHPHIKDQDELERFCGLYKAPAGIPAEILLSWAQESFEMVTVFHHGSSTLNYIDCERMEYVLL